VNDKKIESETKKLEWETPTLEELGEIEDVAGGVGLPTDGGLVGS
jgi:hypothetical protein